MQFETTEPGQPLSTSLQRPNFLLQTQHFKQLPLSMVPPKKRTSSASSAPASQPALMVVPPKKRDRSSSASSAPASQPALMVGFSVFTQG